MKNLNHKTKMEKNGEFNIDQEYNNGECYNRDMEFYFFFSKMFED